MTDLRDPQWWEVYFAPGGGWEHNGGRRQTRIFAEQFTKRFAMRRDSSFSLLDVGCALGDALRHFAETYPNAALHGIDFSRTAVERCRAQLGGKAAVAVGDIEGVLGRYDVIYCSNTLEHFADYEAKARRLISHCARLCVLVPYQEMRDGRPLVPDPEQHHQVTFHRRSFDFLITEGGARRITTAVFSCPGAWGWPLRKRIIEATKNPIRVLLGRPPVFGPKQIFYDIWS